MGSRSLAFPVLIVCLLSAACPSGAQPKLGPGPVEAGLFLERSAVRAGDTVPALVRLRMEEGWYVYGPEADGSGLPTTVRWSLPEGFHAGPLQWPAARRIEIQGVETHGYPGELMILAEITIPAGLSAGSRAVLGAEVGWLACRNECVPGKATLSVEISVVAGSTSADPAVQALFREARARLSDRTGERRADAPIEGARPLGVLLALLLAFTGGLLLNLMPCVFPVLSLKVLALVRQSGADRREALRHALWYTAGILASFWAIAVLLSALRAGGHLLGWGFQFQEPSLSAAAAVLFFLLGLNLFGVYEVGAGLGGAGTAARTRGGRLGSFAGGLFTTVVATPCSAPFMGAALGFALAQETPVTLAVFTALGLGLAFPFVLLSTMPGMATRMPKPGRWMETLRNLLGFPLMATVVWMAWILAVQTDAGTVIALLEGLLAAAAGAWVWGRWGGLDRSRGSRTAACAVAVVLVASGLTLAVGSALGADRAAPGTVPGAASNAAPEAASGTAPEAAPGDWEPWSPERLERALAEGKTVFVDFTAQWCLTCKLNEGTTLSNRRVRERFRDLGVVLLKADWTDRNDAIASALADMGRAGVPLYALYAGGSGKPELLPELLTPWIVLEALETAR